MAAYPHTLSELEINGVTLPNRIVRPAHVTMLGLDDPSGISDRLIDYHVARAKGGVGLTILEIVSGHSASPATLNSFNPALKGGYERLVDAVKPHGMKLFQQLWHGGHNARPLDGGPPWSASDIPGPIVGVPAIPMTKAMIDEVIGSYVLSAKVAKDSGIDGVEVHGSHGYLLQQFLSPLTNLREDEYGGSFENRSRLLFEVLAAVRAEVGPDYPVGLRIGPDCAEGGFGVEECIRLAKDIEDKGIIDFLDVSQGSYFNIPKIIGAMHEPQGYQMDDSSQVTEVVSIPTLVTGRFRTLEEAEQTIRIGDADMVGMVRATIADPDLVAKTIRGEETAVRPCIGCNQGCIGPQMDRRGPLGCTVNPAVGFEKSIDDQMLGKADTSKKVLIVGGGPAGMEAARVAAHRGHDVVLYEADKDLGGKLRLAKQAPFRASIGDVATWLEAEIYRLGVDVRLNSYVEENEIGEIAPDAVIQATGSMPRLEFINSGRPNQQPVRGNQRLLSSLDVFAKKPSPEDGPYVVQDNIGHYEGVAVTEYLLAADVEVVYVTRYPSFAPLMAPALTSEPALARLSAFDNFTLKTAASIGRWDAGQVDICSPGGQSETVDANAVVMISNAAAPHDLFDYARENTEEAYIIGDAKSPRFLETAMREGREIALAL